MGMTPLELLTLNTGWRSKLAQVVVTEDLVALVGWTCFPHWSGGGVDEEKVMEDSPEWSLYDSH